MKSHELIYPLFCELYRQKKDDRQPIDTVIYTNKLTYNTTYIVQAKGDRKPGRGKLIDSALFVTSFYGPDEIEISITYISEIEGTYYHIYKGSRQ